MVKKIIAILEKHPVYLSMLNGIISGVISGLIVGIILSKIIQ